SLAAAGSSGRARQARSGSDPLLRSGCRGRWGAGRADTGSAPTGCERWWRARGRHCVAGVAGGWCWGRRPSSRTGGLQFAAAAGRPVREGALGRAWRPSRFALGPSLRSGGRVFLKLGRGVVCFLPIPPHELLRVRPVGDWGGYGVELRGGDWRDSEDGVRGVIMAAPFLRGNVYSTPVLIQEG